MKTHDHPCHWGEQCGVWVVEQRLKSIRTQIVNECVSMGELIELEGLADHIDPSDVLLLEWAGVPEFSE